MIKVLSGMANFDELAAQIRACPAEFYAVWNMDEEIAPLLRGLPKSILEKLYRKQEARHGLYSIFYIRNKVLCLRQGELNVIIYHLAQYFPGYDNPGEDAAQKCADELEGALHDMKIWPKKLTSPIAIYEQHFMSHMDLPTAFMLPPGIEAHDWEKCVNMAWNCAGKQWVETYQMGHWDKAFDYDLNSAFPRQMIDLLDTRYMRWRHSEDYQPKAKYGWARCWVKITEKALVHPIMFTDDDGGLSTPVGSFETYLTKAKIDFIERYKLGVVDILDGWWCQPVKEVKPLEAVVPRLLKYKEHSNPVVKKLAKGMAVGFWGKMMEMRGDEPGDYYNPFWASYITDPCSMLVADMIYKNRCWDNVIAISVDGVLLDKEVPVLDGWKLSGTHEAIVLGDGDVWFGDRKPRGFEVKELKRMMQHSPNKGYYSKKLPQVVTLDMAMSAGEPDSVGQTIETETAIDLFRLCPNRRFERIPQTGGQVLSGVYRSKPVYRADIVK